MLAVTFSRHARLHYLDAGEHSPAVGDKVLFPTSTTPEVVEVVWGPEWVDDVGGLPVCAGPATDADLRRDDDNKRRRAEIQVAAQRLIREHKLPMKISGVDWADVGHESGRATATVFFTAPVRVDFRQLVRDLATDDRREGRAHPALAPRRRAGAGRASARAAARPAARPSSSTSSRSPCAWRATRTCRPTR